VAKNKMFVGISIVAIGVIFLLQNLGLISINAWQIIWPILIVILGLSMMYRTEKRGNR
jgi:hypothetical protein